jgi:hypothetical protein
MTDPEVLRVMQNLVDEGGLFRTARGLNDYGIPVLPYGRRWTPRRLERFLKSERDTGEKHAANG